MYRLKTTANFNVGGGGTVEEVIHDNTLIGKGTSESPLRVDQSQFAKPSDLTTKQDTLVSGTNIKTINNQSILGSGNIDIEGGSGEGLSTEVKNAILDCFENVAWVNDQGQTYYNALSDLFFPPIPVVSISATFNQGQNVIYDDATLDSLKQYLTVTALYEDESTETVTDYLLSGTLSAGSSTITVTYEGKTTTFTVNVTARPELSSINAVFTQGDNVIYDTDSLDNLKQYLVVTATYSDSSTETVTDYTLSGTLAEGTSTITVTYSNKTDTFDVTVSTHSLYSLENRAFSNEQINTEVVLLENDRDFSIAMDINVTTTPSSGTGSNTRFLVLVNEEASGNTIAFGKSTGSYCFAGWQGASDTACAMGTGRIRFVYTHVAGSGKALVKSRKDTGTAVSNTLTSTFVATPRTVRFGGSTDIQKLATGTINKAYIYDYAMTENEINLFLGL